MPDRFTETCRDEATHHDWAANDWHRYSFATSAEMMAVLEDIVHALEAAGFSGKEVFSVRLALEEAVMNALRHGNRFDRAKHVEVRCRVSPECVLAEVEDEGTGFDPGRVPDPREPENLERDCGRGLLLMRSYMTWVRFNERGTCVTLCKVQSAKCKVRNEDRKQPA